VNASASHEVEAPAAVPARAPDEDWHAANQRFLTAALGLVRRWLERHAGGPEVVGLPERVPAEGQELGALAGQMIAPPALETLCARFGLTSFERNILLLCAAVELDGSLASLCGVAMGQQHAARPTFGLALAALPGAHWSALLPAAPLRWFQLVELGPSESLTQARLRIDERILHALVGLDYLDDRLAAVVRPAEPQPLVVPGHRKLAAELARLIAGRAATNEGALVQLLGEDGPGKREIAFAACEALSLRLCVAPAAALPAHPAESAALARLWSREAMLGDRALLIECDRGDGGEVGQALRFAERTAAVTLLAARQRPPELSRPSVALEVRRPSRTEQRALWRQGLGPLAHDALTDTLTAHFDLAASSIRASCADAAARVTPEDRAAEVVWSCARMQARVRLDDLAQRIEGQAGWDDLVLPAAQTAVLRDIVMQVRHRAQVYETWQLGGRCGRGLGVSALFSGPSGTGKTMAAEVIASELRLDLFRIDLSQVVNKYIGETEKNLRRVFDAAEEGGAILLFDEADALFGKRSEVKDSHDRFANIEVGYLLQRMESYRGLAILTTNLRNAIDPAFMRRIRFLVQFPFPTAAERARIWRSVLPTGAPVEALDVDRLIRLNVSGGVIRNIALNAAFLAADAGTPVRMEHLLRAAQNEYTKLERPLTAAEFGDWLVPREAGR
jgi:hypothetical protein